MTTPHRFSADPAKEQTIREELQAWTDYSRAAMQALLSACPEDAFNTKARAELVEAASEMADYMMDKRQMEEEGCADRGWEWDQERERKDKAEVEAEKKRAQIESRCRKRITERGGLTSMGCQVCGDGPCALDMPDAEEAGPEPDPNIVSPIALCCQMKVIGIFPPEPCPVCSEGPCLYRGQRIAEGAAQ